MEDVTHFDLAVVGGGPAGSAAAITAARAGATVVLFERGKLPRHKVCGEFLSPEAGDLLTALLAGSTAANYLPSDPHRVKMARFFLDGHVLHARLKYPATILARYDLDAALWRAATEAKVSARQQSTVQSISGIGPFEIRTAQDTVAARAVVNATGRWSNLAASRDEASANLKQRNKNGRWIGLKAHFSEDNPAPSTDLYFFDGGYCGVQPVIMVGGSPIESRVNASAVVRADIASSLETVFQQNPQLAARTRSWSARTESFSTAPIIFRDPEPERDGVLMAGDAGGFVDPFVGDGVSLALRTGTLAAQCLLPFIQGDISLPNAAANYREEYASRFLRVFRTSSRLRRMFQLPKALRIPVLFALERMPGVVSLLVEKTR